MPEVGDAVVIVKTEKMNPKFISSGFQFTAQKLLSDGSEACLCVERGRGCKARVKIRAGHIVAVVRGLHSHALASLRTGLRGELGEAAQRARGTVAVDKRIHELAQDFDNRPALRYLHAQAANLGTKN